MNDDLPWYARHFDAAYLEVYAHRDAAEAEQATKALLEPLGLHGKRVLDLGCGAGRYLAALGARGAGAVGVDLSAALLREAGAALGGGPLGLVRADMARLPFRAASFDLVLSMFTSFGYFATGSGDRAMLAEIGRVLRHGGDLVLDFMNADLVRRSLVPESRRRSGRFEVLEKRWLDAARGTVVKQIEISVAGERHAYREEVRLWSRAELTAALLAVGLQVQSVWGDYEGRPFEAESSPRLILQARVA